LDPFSIGAKILGLLKDLTSYIWRKWWPPKFGYKLAHSNVLEVIRPYVHKGKVIELLGQPHEVEHGRAGYRFSNALLQVNYEEDVVQSVALVSLKMRWPNRFKIFPLAFVMGSSTFAEVCQGIQGTIPIELQVNFSSKFFCVWGEQYFGNFGRYFYYSFALLSADTYPVVEMPHAIYEAIEPGQIQNGAHLKSTDSRFNAIAISRNENDTFCFDFTLFN
jgi:hypothetical protein